jgi:hypothetical protein
MPRTNLETGNAIIDTPEAADLSSKAGLSRMITQRATYWLATGRAVDPR